ncbi:HET-domain-containing protein [Thozetella sp. PMI_491]|nr:HET-domain-containing protein [Thozetella sp. PMI_491]
MFGYTPITGSRRTRSGFAGLGDALQHLTFEATAGLTSMSFSGGEVNRYARSPTSRSLTEGPVLRRPVYLEGLEATKYAYCPISDGDDFRILKVWPSANLEDECIRCALLPARISEWAGKYDTLSYTWGLQAQDFPVLITDSKNEGIPNASVSVTPHLYAALLRLRHESEPVHLWIDQLCIDQDSVDEKGLQVALMADIYRSSRRTVVWLGASDSVDEALLRDLIAPLRNRAFTTLNDDIGYLRGLLPVTSRGLPPSLQAEQRRGAFTRMLNRTWFTRAWIFQEVVLSRDVDIRIGRLSIPLTTLIRLADAVCEEEVRAGGYAKSIIMSTVGFDALFLIKHKRGCGDASCKRDSMLQDSFLALLMQTLHQFRATDPRDFIYAYLAFQNGSAASTIRPDYRLSPAKVWTATAKSIIRQTKSLDIFASARGRTTIAGGGGQGFGGGLPSSKELPSWVPYWSEVFPYARPLNAPDFTTSFDAARGRMHEWVDGDEVGELVAQGMDVSKVEWVSPFIFSISYYRSSSNGTKGILDLDNQIEAIDRHLGVSTQEQSRQFHTLYPDRRIALMRTLLADGAFGHQQHLSDEKIRQFMMIADCETAIQEKDDLAREGKVEKSVADKEEYQKLEDLRDRALIVQQKLVFLTENGQLGLASKAVEVGDQVWVLHGSRTPCLLREDPTSGMLRLIGQCYLEGFMYGEATLGADSWQIVLI